MTFAQGQGQPQLRQPITNAVAPDIPGVVAGGTKIQLIKWGFQVVEGGAAYKVRMLTDGFKGRPK